ncbi:NAD(P)H-dependent oxidoreductase [Pectobacterium sp. CHL-2024]|uniref:Flavodoxin n=1 Tax=Pectobacterium betavasculorum TaxID=55207 RepID=A0ABR4V1M1_9GAMM|nr:MULTISPECIES: NAD(P)H-dependent oxidoreductase [Pectobacterium]ATV42074.1 flavodoxin family protein [Pectobacterium brasiliense]KFX21144.1 flavodoxin [Pectobacterium betavasculorum]MBA0207725.1 NAD(P)H-dependent oxidoreductase [Pectobacterium brasiliense]MCA6983662.1 NAD(P)H-dependent oxidoreductase [Pectobacterium brasiliense]MCH4993211.1 NAD(P)H-dependent oxidoreductase [Pectobacterium brasiliense]
MKNVLIINAHQFYEGISSGSLNKTLISVIQEAMEKRGYTVKLTHIDQGYDINEEVEKHLWADIIITQSPVYWFSTPWIYKKYVDEVFTAGLMQQCFLVDDGRTRQDPSRQYGSGGKMQGKQYMLSLTWNAPKEAFDDKEQILFSGKSVDDVFAYNTVNYKFCGVEPVPSFSCFDVMKAPEIEKDIERLKEHLAYVFS